MKIYSFEQGINFLRIHFKLVSFGFYDYIDKKKMSLVFLNQEPEVRSELQKNDVGKVIEKKKQLLFNFISENQ